MLRKLIATGIVFVAGYVIGVKFGFRAAVADYIENDAKLIENVASEIYSSTQEQQLPEAVGEAIEEANAERIKDDGSKGYQ